LLSLIVTETVPHIGDVKFRRQLKTFRNTVSYWSSFDDHKNVLALCCL